MSSRKVVQGVLTGFLVFVFIAASIPKISDKLSPNGHLKMKQDFVRFAKVHPAVLFGYEIDPQKFMYQIGVIELACAILLLMGPRFLKMFSCLILSSVMIGALYSLYKLEEPIANCVPAAGILLLLFLRLNFILMGNPPPSKDSKAQKVD